MKEQKKQLRKEIREEKKRHSPEELMAYSSSLLKQIEKHPHFLSSSTVLLYHSLSDEVQTHAFVEKWHKVKKVLLPVVRGDILVLRHYTGKECLEVGAFGIEEPSGEDFKQYHEIEFSLVPGMSFDKQGNRLGRGKGYYDKLLPLLPHSYNIGICYQFQAREEIPAESFDKRMNEVWTEKGHWN